MHKNKLLLTVILLCFCAQYVSSQNNTNSPRTRFGYGEISDNASGNQQAMGGTSIAVHNKNRINTVNPASYSCADSLTFMLDFGTSALVSMLSEGNSRKFSKNGNIEYLTLQFRLFKGIGMSTGLLPYSFSGYNFSQKDSIDITSFGLAKTHKTFEERFTGSGGFSQFYTGISFDLFNYLSLGANAYYMFGNSNNVRSLAFSDNSSTPVTEITSIKANNFRFRYGVQFYNTFANKHDLSLGLIYEFKSAFRADAERTTIENQTKTIDISKDFELPQLFGAGLYYTYDKKLSVGLDYNLQQWSDVKFYGKTDSLSNSFKLSLGAEYQPNYKSRKLKDQIMYRCGLKVSSPYYNMHPNKSAKNFGMTFGVGIPLRNSSRTMLNTAFEYGKVGTLGMLKEDYFKLTFNLTLTESWFYKRKL